MLYKRGFIVTSTDSKGRILILLSQSMKRLIQCVIKYDFVIVKILTWSYGK